MFTLALLADDIPIAPEDFRDDQRDQLKRQIQLRYVDRIIPNVGLCIEFYNFVSIKDATIYPGDGKHSCGEAFVKVEFQLIVFQPLIDEWLVGLVMKSTQKGLQISLGFFEDVEIPSANLRTPYMYDSAQERWVWLYRDEETNESVNYFYDKDRLIRFRVTAVHFAEARQNRRAMSIVGAVGTWGWVLLVPSYMRLAASSTTIIPTARMNKSV
ncbi:unnamed protein product [Cladocopium goreaui]|uniref:DNA-directed RNA polymerase III subunit RPC8 n=1 Tax=Cladocopium goreaui TaxID=2562237 RepID=A0A9P1G7U6_9DINO|nr:unnamed protein product [Cladocopium goreaui]